jgi:acetyltransferase
LEISARGEPRLVSGSRRLALPDPEGSLRALALLCSRPAVDAAPAPPAIPADADVVELIVRPPARLLSETASKRLVQAFGIALPREALSASPTESARIAAELGEPVVLKLVRPQTSGKADLGAVVIGVRGPARIRRVHHELERLGASLGPPAPLGVLVASEVADGARFWIASAPHAELGAVVLGGTGDRPSPAPGFALKAPATEDDAARAIARAAPQLATPQRTALAAAVARFSSLVSTLGARIDRAEIHPLVAPPSGPAVALDALIGVAG